MDAQGLTTNVLRSILARPTEYTKPSADDLNNRYSYHAPKGDQGERYEGVRQACLVLAKKIVASTPASREQENALNALDQVMFFSNASIARNES